MHWIKAWFGKQDDHPQTQQEAFQRRERELQERLERLERLAVEADVIQRTDTSEWSEP